MILTASVAIATAALANDTTASSAAGGLVLERTDDIDMVSEDLFVSADEVRVRYVFRNVSASNIDTIVAFPMPGRDLGAEYEGDVAYPSEFATRVGGKPIKAQLERKAMLKGKDYTELLGKLRVPLAPAGIAEATRVMDGVTRAEKQHLISTGLAIEEEYDEGKGMKKHLVPMWTVRERWWWNQRFPAGRAITIAHRYVPGAGASVESPIAFRKLRRTDDGKAMIAKYCVDTAFIRAVDRLSRTGSDEGPRMPDKRVDYVLTTGANWRSPIGSFRLVVDKGRPENLVSFCEEGVKKISPTQFEVRRRDWRPDRDLHVLIIEPQQ